MILPIEQQVCSLESAKRLKELNFSQESYSVTECDHSDTEPHVHYAYYKNELMPFTYFSEAESRAKMLIYLADQRLINPEEIK